MIQKFVSIGALAAACLLSPVRTSAGQTAPAAAETPQAAPDEPQSDAAVEEKFQKLQREMEGDDTGRMSAGTRAAMASRKPPEARSLGSLAFQIVFGLIFVLILAVVTIRILKRLQGRLLSKPGKTAGGNLFEVLETCHLGTNQKVVALRMNDGVGILGVTPQGISLLSMLKEPAAEVRQAYAGESNSALFSENLNRLLERFKKPKRVSDLLDETRG